MNHTLSSISRSERLARYAGIFLTFVFAASYIVSVNASSTKGYTLTDLQKNTSALRLENSRINAEVTRLRSLSSLQVRTQFTDLVPVTHIEYVRAPGENVAVR